MSEIDPFAFERIVIKDPGGSMELRQLIPDDASTYFDLVDFDRAHLSQFGEPTASKYPTVNSVLESIVHPENPDKYRFGIWVEGTMVGSNNITLEGDGVAETGSWISAQHIGSHYAAKARNLLVNFAFTTLGVRKIISLIDEANAASRRSVEKSGFRLQEIRGSTCVYTFEKQTEKA